MSEDLKDLKDIIPNFKLSLVGSGRNLSDLKEFASEQKIENFISFEGWQKPLMIPSYMMQSDICVIPHLKTAHTDNTIPHKLFQYMLCKKPIISSDCAPIERIINETKSGLIYKSGDHNSFTKAVIQLYENPDLRKSFGINGYNAVRSKYNWTNTANNLIELYKKIELDLVNNT